jgi:hypothetical protein
VELIGGVPGRVEPTVPPMLVLGGGTPINGLTPALLSSVDPSGIFPESALGPTEDGGIAVPMVAEPDDAVVQPGTVVPADAIPLMPPPSKLEPVVDVDMPGPLEMPNPGEPTLQAGAGLSPPGLISVAPRPMPALDPLIPVEPPIPYDPVAPLAPGIPSGVATPIAGAVGVVDMVCAAATPQLNKSATAAADNRRIEISCPVSSCATTLTGRLVTLISIEIWRAIKLVLRTLNLISQTGFARRLLREIALACVELRGRRELSCSLRRQMS